MESRRRKKSGIGYTLRNIARYLYIPLALFYLEMVLKIHCYDDIPFKGIIYTFLFSLSLGMAVQIIASAFNRKTCQTISEVFLGLVTLLIGVQAVYFTIFKTFTTISAVTMAGDALTNYWRETLAGIGKSAFAIILILLPLLIYIFTSRKFTYKRGYGWQVCLVLLIVPIILFALTSLFVRLDSKGGISYKYVYYNTFAPLESVNRFGVVTTFRLDIENLIKPKEEDLNGPTDLSGIGNDNPNTPVTYKDNVMEIDFDQLIANESSDTIKDMHEYFKSVTPTKQNKYTGMFEGYNLIWICAEGFSEWAVDETHTPTLYKLTHEGFVFKNFYNPIWYASTTDGEYTTTTGLIPKAGIRSYSTSASNYMPFGFGTMFKNLGYTARAYHNHTFEYYGRDKSHPNMGYEFKARGNGLEITGSWPESDLEMMQVTIPEYINDEHFHTYYMTVSGHLQYNFQGNAMSRKHQEEVQDLPYSDAAKAYIACNMEFDKAMEYLLDELEKAGKLDNTVIVFSGDHYPYGLTESEMQELSDWEIDPTFEMFRSALCIWNSKMETVEVDKYCSALDVMPTLCNLFGLEYDSRLIIGQDILSDSPALVMFNDKSYITDYGRYNAKTDTFTPNEGVTVPEGYASDVLNVVKAKFKYSVEILENDYYAKVFKS